MDEKIIYNIIGDDFKILKKIGKGAFSRVYLAQYKSTHVNYALKIIDCENIKTKILVDREIDILKIINNYKNN
tara:strand:- start:297 stop:515 length:219 start_codon:yes stop_codon:yes gene_type:complete